MTSIVRFVLAVILSGLLFCNICFAATQRTAEDMLSSSHQSLKKENVPVEPTPQPEKKEKSIPLSKSRGLTKVDDWQPKQGSNVDEKKTVHVVNKVGNEQNASLNDVQIKLQGCNYDSGAQVVICSFQLTSPSDACKIALYCYSGIQAVDENNKTLQCNDVQVGQEHSWEYVFTTLDKGASVTSKISLQTLGNITSISKMQMVISANGKRQIIQLTNIAVH